jgi:internalin A
MQDLTSLTLREYYITEKADWEQLKKLTSLCLDLGEGDNLDALKQLTNLSTLTLSSTKLMSLDGLDHLTRLNSLTLNLRGAPIKELSPIQYLKNLKTLNLDVRSTNVRNVDELAQFGAGLTSVKLDLADSYTDVHNATHVSSLACLQQLKSLKLAELWLPLDLVTHCARLKMDAVNKLVGFRQQQV